MIQWSTPMRSIVPLILAATIPAAPLPAQTAAPPSAAAVAATSAADTPLGQGEGRAVAAKLASELLSTFVIHDSAVRYAAMLRSNAAAGRYDEGTRGQLAKSLTDDLMAVQKDGHLHVELAQHED